MTDGTYTVHFHTTNRGWLKGLSTPEKSGKRYYNGNIRRKKNEIPTPL